MTTAMLRLEAAYRRLEVAEKTSAVLARVHEAHVALVEAGADSFFSRLNAAQELLAATENEREALDEFVAAREALDVAVGDGDARASEVPE